MRLLCRVALAGAALGLLAAPAGARTAVMKPFAAQGGVLLSDGERYAAYATGTGTVRLMDTAQSRSVVLQAPNGCPFWTFGGGQALFFCAGDRSRSSVTLYDIARREFHHPAGAEAIPDPTTIGDVTFGAVGARWLTYYQRGYRGAGRGYLDWRTGERRDVGAGGTSLIDLNHQHLVLPMCSPFIRSPEDPDAVEYGGADDFRYFAYEPPFGLSYDGTAYRLQRCGHARPLRRCECRSAQLSAGLMSWWDFSPKNGLRYAHVLNVKTGRAQTWRIRNEHFGDLVHTRHWLFDSAFTGVRTEVRIARIPARVSP